MSKYKNTINLRKIKDDLRYHPESFLTKEGYKTKFYNYLKVHKVTILPSGNSLGHTAMLPEGDILSQNKQDLLKFIGKNNIKNIYLF